MRAYLISGFVFFCAEKAKRVGREELAFSQWFKGQEPLGVGECFRTPNSKDIRLPEISITGVLNMWVKTPLGVKGVEQPFHRDHRSDILYIRYLYHDS